MKSAKGQTGLILMVLLVIIFAGIAIFLFTLARTVSQEEYMNIYVHNLLLAIMRTDTGYTDAECKLISDLLACAALTPTHLCGGTGPDCLSLANQTITEYMNRFGTVRKNYRYLLIVGSGGFVPTQTGRPLLEIGDKELATARISKITANEVVQREGYILEVSLIIARRVPRR